MIREHNGRFLAAAGLILVLLPGGCDMFSVSAGLPPWYAHTVATRETIPEAFAGLLSVIVTFSFLSWALLGLGSTLFMIGRRRQKATRHISLATSGDQLVERSSQMDRILNVLKWIFAAGTFGTGCAVLYFLIALGQFPTLYEPQAPVWGYVVPAGASDAEVQRAKEALRQTMKSCVLKFAPNDALGPGDAVTFRFSGWFTDTGKVDQIETCMSDGGYNAISHYTGGVF